MITLGFDTSNYTTSEAFFNGKEAVNVSRLLNVRPGELGLRQSDALFSHVKNIPEIAEEIRDSLKGRKISAVGVSSRPRSTAGSYMPCFLAGVASAKAVAEALNVPCFNFSHQEGHIAAVLHSSGRAELKNSPFLAWHLSGGTTELLLVIPDKEGFHVETIGGTTDISAGQIIDRTGKALNIAFPSGKSLDKLSLQSSVEDRFHIKTSGYLFSISGLENKMNDYMKIHGGIEDTARFVINSLCDLILRVTSSALSEYRGYPVLFSGGVSSNTLLRETMKTLPSVFGSPALSTDNAAGIAVLTYWKVSGDE